MMKRSMRAVRSPLMLAAAVGGLTLLVGVGPATAGSWAVVVGSGSSPASKGVRSIVVNGTGHYSIVFKRKLFGKNGRQKCVPVVTIAGGHGEIGAVATGADPGGVDVHTFDSTGVAADLSFYVALIC